MGIKYIFNPTTGSLDAVSVETPAGADTEIQFNNAGAFGADSDLTWDDTSNPKVLGIGGDINLDDGGTYTTTLQTVTPTQNNTISFPNATGTIGLVAGSSGQLLYNASGANAGTSTITYDGTNVTLTGRFISSLNGALSATGIAGVPVAATGTWIAAGGTATTTKPQVLIEPTGTTSTAWSTSGTGLGVNAASGFAGNLFDLQVNGTSNFNVRSAGTVQIGSTSTTTISGNNVVLTFTGGGVSSLSVGNNGLGTSYADMPSSGYYSWNNDVRLFRDAAGILAQRTATNAQTFRVYGTYTDASNYVRAALSSTSTAVTLAAETAGTGADDIPLNLTAAGTGTIKVNSVAEVVVSSTVAGLPAAPVVGMLTRVTDATAPAVGVTVVGGGAAAALCWYNGASWSVIGV